MKRLLLGLVLLLSFSTTLYSITLDEILERHAEALGGMEALENFESIHFQADMTMGGLKGTAELYMEKPEKYKVIMDLQILKVEQGQYEGRYWIKDQTGTLRNMGEGEIKQMRTENLISSYDYILDPDQREHITLVGQEEYNDRQCYRLEYNPPDADRTIIFINSDNYLLEGSMITVLGMQVKSYYTDWRIVDGIKMPFKTIQDLGNPMLLTTLEVTGVEINEDFPETVFIPPQMGGKGYAFRDDLNSTSFTCTIFFNHVYLKVFINGQGPYSFILDSGAGISFVEKSLADKLGLEDAGTLPAIGLGGLDVGYFTRLDSIALGDLTLYDLNCGVLDFSQFNQLLVDKIEGIIGYDLFAKLIVEVDYGDSAIAIYDPETEVYPGGEDTLECTVENNHPVVKGSVNDSIPARFRIDTGSQNYLDLSAPFVRKYDLLAHVEKELGTYDLVGVGGTSQTTMAILSSVSLGEERMEDVLTGFYQADTGPFAMENIDGNVGGGILSSFRVGFDYQGNRMYLTRVIEPGEEEGFLTCGVLLKEVDDEFYIYKIIPGTSADDCELQTGDKVLKLDGKSLKGKSMEQVIGLLKGDAGDKIKIEFEQDGEKQKCTLEVRSLMEDD